MAKLCVFIPFASTYLCEAGFSTLVHIKPKYWNKGKTQPRFACGLQKQIAH